MLARHLAGAAERLGDSVLGLLEAQTDDARHDAARGGLEDCLDVCDGERRKVTRRGRLAESATPAPPDEGSAVHACRFQRWRLALLETRIARRPAVDRLAQS